MGMFSVLYTQTWTLKKKLFGYMLLLTTLLLFILFIGLFSFVEFSSPKKNTYESLDIQMEVFQKDISTHFDSLAAASISLSKEMTILLETYINKNDIGFNDFTNSQQHLSHIQEQMMEPLKQSLLQKDCSGIFVLLNTTINTSLSNATHSKSGLYLQVNGYEMSTKDILLYRGISHIGKTHGIMPHRKWRMEFDTTTFPNYDKIVSLSSLPLEKSYYLTDLFILPGTSEKAILVVVPIKSSKDEHTFYGICGFEISESYFMTYHAQPSKISHLTCLLSTRTKDTINASLGLSCGLSNGYHRTPKGILNIKQDDGKLISILGDTIPYIGITQNITLSPNNDAYVLTTMIPKKDYERDVSKYVFKHILLLLLLLFFTVTCCFYFSRQFITPILKDLEQIQLNQWNNTEQHTKEIHDLFAFLSEKDKEHELHLNLLLQKKEEAQKECTRLQLKYEQAKQDYEAAQTEISRLAYSRKQEIDPDNYQLFLDGIHTLTPTERKIFEYYLSGKTVKEILEIALIKESTLRYHNQNIYGKLGVNSLKQLLRYATLMKQDNS